MTSESQPFDVRQHMRTQSFESFRYSDAHPDNVELHYHDFFEIYLFLSGKVDYCVETHIYHLMPGDMLLISPFEHHRPMATEKKQSYERIVLWINKPFLQYLSPPQTNLSRCFDTSIPNHANLLHLTPSQHESITKHMEALVWEERNAGYGGDAAAVALLIQLLVKINRIALTARGNCAQEGIASPVVTQVVEYINEHYAEDLSLDMLANMFFISKYYLSHEFSRLMGISVYRYIIRRRLVAAKQMLSVGSSSTDAYRNCGFSDYANFYRAFKREYHLNPKKFAELSKDADQLSQL